MLVPRRAEDESGQVIGDALVDIGPDDPEWGAWQKYFEANPAMKFAWDEAKHPRDKDGKWTDAGGSDAVNKVEPKLRDQFLRAEKELATRQGATDNEQAVVLFPAFGYMSHSRGSATAVKFSEDEVAEMRNDGNAILTHNHPTRVFGGQATVVGLSVDDIVMGHRANLAEMRAVVDHKSGYYIFSLKRGGGWPTKSQIENFRHTDERYAKVRNVAKRYWQGVKQNDPKRKTVELGVSHARTKLIAEKFGLKYKMTKISDANVRA